MYSWTVTTNKTSFKVSANTKSFAREIANGQLEDGEYIVSIS